MNKMTKSDHAFDLDAEPEPLPDSQDDHGYDMPMNADDFVAEDDDNDAGM